MTESVDTVQEQEPEPPVLGPGNALRTAREAKALSVADIAQALKFSPRQIEAIEADDHAALPGVTFVRGAVRSYARYLKLDPAPLLALLDATAPAALPDVRPPQNMGIAMADRGGRLVSPLLLVSALLLLVAGLIGAWRFLGGSAASNPQAEAAAVSPPAEALQPVTPPQLTAEPAVPGAPPAAAEPSPPADAPAPASAPTLAPAPAPAVAPASGSRQLIFVFGEKSWVELKDASQQIIFTGEQAAGSRQVISGKPPFQLVIGKAGKVELFDGDRQIDLRPYTRAEVARLTLD